MNLEGGGHNSTPNSIQSPPQGFLLPLQLYLPIPYHFTLYLRQCRQQKALPFCKSLQYFLSLCISFPLIFWTLSPNPIHSSGSSSKDPSSINSLSFLSRNKLFLFFLPKYIICTFLMELST